MNQPQNHLGGAFFFKHAHDNHHEQEILSSSLIKFTMPTPFFHLVSLSSMIITISACYYVELRGVNKILTHEFELY